MSFPRYPAYKDSGVAWLGEVPGHWEVKRLKQACHVFPSNVDKKAHDGETPVQLCNYTDVYYNDTIVVGMEFMAATASTDQIAKFTLRAGDTIITKDSETADDIAIGAYVPADLPGVVCGYHLSMIRPMADTDGAFVKRLFDSIYTKSCVAIRANGLTRVGLGQYDLDNLDLPFPPFPEQIQIAAFLDRETAKIDALVAEQRRLMALLKEKRQAIISHAVTRGLNPDAPMKPSGIEWLGEVPAHWEVKPVKFIAKIGNGSTPSREVPEYWAETGFPWLNSSVVNSKVVTEPEGFVTERALRECHLPIVVPPAILVGITGQGRTRGMVAMLGIQATINQHVAYVKPNSVNLDANYLLGIFESLYLKLRHDSEEAGATKGAITCGQIGELRVPVPPVFEQNAIVIFLDAELAKFDTLTTEAQRAIALLQDRRTALISVAVTGQIDVRGAI
jgi:type I restriction enzyme S subunit